jgi:hypothetical protein
MDERHHKARLQSMDVFTEIEPMLDTLDGMTAAVQRRGFTEDQARAIVAYLFSYRAPNASTPDGAGE